MKTKISQFAAVALLTALTAATAQAGFMGRTLQATYSAPEVDRPYSRASADPANFVVGSGIETTVDVEGVTWIAVDFTDRSVRFDFTTSLINPSPTWSDFAFNGIVFDRISGDAFSLISPSIDPSSTLTGFDASRVGLSDDQLTVNWHSLPYVDGTFLLINFAPVPEPGSLALLGMALAGWAGIARRKHAKTAAPTLL